MYYKNNVPRFSFRMVRLFVWYVQWKNRNFGYSARIYIFYWNVKSFWIFYTELLWKFVISSKCFRILWVTKVYEVSRLLQIVLFLTNSVFYVLFTYFDESMVCIGGCEPRWSWNTLNIMLWNLNAFTTVPKGSNLLYYANGSHKGFVKFCVDEVFEDRGVINMRRIRETRVRLGMSKAPK